MYPDSAEAEMPAMPPDQLSQSTGVTLTCDIRLDDASNNLSVGSCFLENGANEANVPGSSRTRSEPQQV